MQTALPDLARFLIDSTREVFRTMMSMDLRPDAQIDEVEIRRSYSVTAMVGFGGEYAGLLTVSCSEAMACTLTEAMLDMPVSEIGPEVTDALGEVSNMIGGNIVVKMSGAGAGELSLPTVIVGHDYRYFVATREPLIRIHFRGDQGGVLVALALAPRR